MDDTIDRPTGARGAHEGEPRLGGLPKESAVTHPTPAFAARGRSARGVAADELRRHNLQLVLQRIHVAGSVRRSDLTALTGLNRSTIADLIGELAGLGLVVEGPAQAAKGPGRPSHVVRPRPEGASGIGVELTVDSLAVTLMGLGGQTFALTRVARDRSADPSDTVEHISRLVGDLRKEVPDNAVLVGVGVAVAGVTRSADGFVHVAPNLGWRDVPLGALIREGLDTLVPVQVANDADLGVLAEHRRGAAAGIEDAIYIGGEVGIGTGILVAGHPLHGTSGYAGESGHMIVNPNGTQCRCGSVGCWESEAGVGALMERIGGTRITGMTAIDDLMERAGAGDETVLDAMTATARWLAIGIANLTNVLNPEIVVLGGLYSRFFEFLQPELTRTLRDHSLLPAIQRVRVAKSALGVDAQLIGAAELALSPVISDPSGFLSHAQYLRAAGEGAPT